MIKPFRRKTIPALLFAVVFTLLFWPAAFRDFRRISVILHKGPLALGDKPLSFAFENPGPAGPGSWILFVKIAGESPSPRKISSVVNGTATGEIELAKGRIRKEFKLSVPGGLIRPGQNRIEVGTGPAEVRLERITAKNLIGYSKGWMSFIVLPKDTPVERGLAWPMTAALALALGILGLLRGGRRGGSAAGKYEVAATILTGLVLGGALLSPRIGGPRILFAARSLWVFVVFLHAPVVFGLLAAAFKEIRNRLSPYLPLLRTKELAARPWLGRAVGLALAAAALAFNVSFMKSVLKIHGGNYSGFLHIYPDTLEKFGRLYLPPRPGTVSPNPLLRTLTTTIEEYDGQYFYFLTFDPFLARYRHDPEKYRWFIDEPAYRSHRIGYPLLVRLLSLGRPRLYPAIMIWLLLAANFAAVYVLSRILIHLGQSPLWALCYLLIPGFHLSLYFGLPEPLAAAFLLAGSYFYLKRKLVPAAAFLAVSLLVRETGILVVIAFAVVEWLKRRNLRGGLVLAGAVLPLVLWRGFVTLRLFPLYGWKTLWFGPGDFTLPFLGMARLGREVLGGTYLYPDIAASALIYAGLVTAIFAAAIILIRKLDAWSLALLLFSVLAVSLNLEKIWLHVDNAARGTSEGFLFLLLAALAGSAGRKARTKYALAGFFALVLIYDLVFSRLSLHFLDGLLLR